MAEQDAQNQQANGADAGNQPQVFVNVQYLKDLSFENPRAPETFSLAAAAGPQVNFDVDVKARTVGPDLYESVLFLRAEAKINDEIIFMAEVSYGSVVTVKNAPEELLHGILLIEVPRLMFPFVREIIASASRNGGYPPLLVNPIDFVELARQRAQQQAGAGNQASA